MHAPQRMQRSASCTSLAEHAGAPAVDEDEVHVLGAVELAGALDAGEDVDVVADRLARRRARQQPHQRRDILERGHDLLDAGDRDVHARQRRRQRRVAFVGDQRRPSRSRRRRSCRRRCPCRRSGSARAARRAPRGTAPRCRPCAACRACAWKSSATSSFDLCSAGADDVRRRLVVVDLQDVFAEIGLDDGHAGGLDRVVERRLLRDHRLRLDDLAHAVAPRDLEHERVDVGRRLRPQHRRAARAARSPRRRQPGVEVVERALADRLRGVARALEVVELGDRRARASRRTCPASSSGSLQLRVVQLVVRAPP